MKYILTADWHLRGERPRARLDEDWIEQQRKDIAFVINLANREKANLIIAGDIFHTPRVATEILYMTMKELDRLEGIAYVLAGNHDLPYHSYDNVHKSSIGVLMRHHKIVELNGTELNSFDTLIGYPFGLDEPGVCDIRVLHRLVFPDAESRPIEGIGDTANGILEEFPDSKFIVTGDYHHHFVRLDEDRALINPGCLNIQASDTIGYKPVVYLLDTKTNKYESIEIPQPEDGFVTNEYIVESRERDERITAFIEAVSRGQGVSLSFTDNVDKKINSLETPLKLKIQFIMEQVGEDKLENTT